MGQVARALLRSLGVFQGKLRTTSLHKDSVWKFPERGNFYEVRAPSGKLPWKPPKLPRSPPVTFSNQTARHFLCLKGVQAMINPHNTASQKVPFLQGEMTRNLLRTHCVASFHGSPLSVLVWLPPCTFSQSLRVARLQNEVGLKYLLYEFSYEKCSIAPIFPKFLSRACKP